MIIGPDEAPLKTEFLDFVPEGATGALYHPKDNGLLPWGAAEPGTEAFEKRFGKSEVTAAFMKAAMPEGQSRARRRS